jgi:hypothetical protein
LLLTSGEFALAIEKFAFIWSADAVVVGQLKLSSYFLSFDGVHVNGTIVATEILHGGGLAGSEFAYHLVVPCSLRAGCDYRALWHGWSEMKELFSRKQIWALVKGPSSSWTSVDPRLAPVYSLTDRERVIEVLQQRRKLGPKP